MDDIELNIVFAGLPPDHGVVTPIGRDYRPYEDVECVRRALPSWPMAQVGDPLQRARNVLTVAAVADVLQMSTERDLPVAVFERLQQDLPKDDLIKILYWIATHPADGDLSPALDQLDAACLDVRPPRDVEQVQERVGLYATKLLGRLIGKIR